MVLFLYNNSHHQECEFYFRQMDHLCSIESNIDIESNEDLKIMDTYIDFLVRNIYHVVLIKTNFNMIQ